MIYRNTTIDIAEFPSLDDFTLAIQRQESQNFKYLLNCLVYTYIREYNGKWFVDCYFYYEDLAYGKICMERFIIAPEFQMREERERRFLAFVNMDCILHNYRVCDNYVEEISKVAPELNMKHYNNIGTALCHTYFASFKSGIREQLFKAGLESIAMDLELINGCNIIAGNVEEAFNVPIKLLRKLNYHRGIENVLVSESGRNNAVTVYKNYHGILNDIDSLNEFQIHYLLECISKDEKVDKKLLKELAALESGWDEEGDEYVNGYDVYKQLREYQKLCDKVNCYKRIFPKYPSLAADDIERFYEINSFLKSYIEHEAEYAQKMKQYARECKKYIYEDSDYEICIAKSPKDILEESEHQHNCLYQNMLQIIGGEITIVFIRSKANRNKSLVTIEIKDGYIKQAASCCNKPPTLKEMRFIEKFAKEKGLIYNGLEHVRNTDNDGFMRIPDLIS